MQCHRRREVDTTRRRWVRLLATARIAPRRQSPLGQTRRHGLIIAHLAVLSVLHEATSRHSAIGWDTAAIGWDTAVVAGEGYNTVGHAEGATTHPQATRGPVATPPEGQHLASTWTGPTADWQGERQGASIRPIAPPERR